MDASCLAELAAVACDPEKWEQLRTKLVRYSRECKLHDELATRLFETEDSLDKNTQVMVAQEEEMMKLISSVFEE
uniref:Uncharacterized protein n=1 Tax=Siphoviridae sp. ctWWc42 TaxID=2826361 RepID=A0A8S5R2D3_9CAUD|nr:MAG TPA: hypothetical protein [Siphoviridae sp. ctWWc42]